MKKAPKQTVKKPTQARSIQIVDAIIKAGRQILEEEGIKSLNTNRVAEVAGVNIASLYRWFPNKEAIVEATFEDIIKEEVDELMGMLAQDVNETITIDQALAYIIDHVLKRQSHFLSLHSEYFQKHQGNFEIGKRQFLNSNQTWIEVTSNWIATVIQEQYPELSSEDCEFKAFICTRLIHSLCLSATSDDPKLLTNKRFRNEVLRLCHHCISG